MTPPRFPPGARSAGPPDVLRSEKGRRVIREFLGSHVYRDLIQGKRGPLEIEDALAGELKARAARLRRSAGATPVDKVEVAALEEGAEVLREILERRRALVAVLDEAMGEGP